MEPKEFRKIKATKRSLTFSKRIEIMKEIIPIKKDTIEFIKLLHPNLSFYSIQIKENEINVFRKKDNIKYINSENYIIAKSELNTSYVVNYDFDYYETI
jgi:hypothetical protein